VCLQYVLDRGQEDDWFGNAGIRWAAVVMVLGLIAFLIRELTHNKPMIDLRALSNRNLALGCVLIFLLGAVIYSLTAVLPVFYQTLMGYDATAAGLAVSPRGLGSIAASIFVGVLVAKLDPRKIVATGFAFLTFSTMWISFLTLDISPTTLFWPITLGGLGMSMVFIPLSKVALGTVSQTEVGNASGIFNFLRNVGGSVGISAANTIAQRHLQTHRSENAHWLSGSNWILQRQLHELMVRMEMHTGPRRALLRAFSITNDSLNHQAQLWAYVDDFRYIALLCAICIPSAFLLKRASKSGGAA
jgi:DHA2 family multidrug resistance protein